MRQSISLKQTLNSPHSWKVERPHGALIDPIGGARLFNLRHQFRTVFTHQQEARFIDGFASGVKIMNYATA
jgi:hypothetical protein